MGTLNDDERAQAAQTSGDAGVNDPKVREAAKGLVAFPNAYPDRDYTVTIDCPEFTAICPMTGQPDFGRMVIEYVPDRWLLELKSLKLYLGAFRDVGIFHETVTNTILDDLRRRLEPRRMAVKGHYNMRGGIVTVVDARWPDEN